MAKPGDVVTVDFPGVTGVKRRPAIIISTDLYHSVRPDVILGLITSQTAKAVQPTDYVLQDWRQAKLRSPSAFRTFLATMPASTVTIIGRLSDRDWAGVQNCLHQALALTKIS
jgi:mRNA interferase MazF